MLIATRIRNLTLHPKDFCRKYSRQQIDDWGYKTAWVKLLAAALDIAEPTVRAWGAPPEFPDFDSEGKPEHARHTRRLAEVDALKQAEAVLRARGLTDDWLQRIDAED